VAHFLLRFPRFRVHFMRFFAPRAPHVLRLAAALLMVMPWAAPASAKESATFVISSSDGYGISDCFVQGAACGPVMADAFCQSNGHGRASAFGLASDITASIPREAAAAVARDPRAMLITCRD
jgi:hypothetical protein